jgi:hypothetical protein
MQINPATKVDLPRMESAGAKRVAPAPSRDAEFTASEALTRALADAPDLRPEALERGSRIAGTPKYPPAEMIDGIANLLAQGVQIEGPSPESNA